MTASATKRDGKGAVAAGHPATAAAAREMLEDGGNAFDAALAAFCAATVAEPVLCSLGGGGFLLAQPAEGEACLYDFFVQTPRRKRPMEEIEFFPILADFGTATQEFHIGLGATGTPGAVEGLFAVHRDLARLPMRRLVEPAVRLARDGLAVRELDAYVCRVVGPVLLAGAESRAIFTGPHGELLKAGDWHRQPELAQTFEALAAEGAALFTVGELGQRLIAACREGGGQLAEEDLTAYRVVRRKPLERSYRGARILTNPPPSSGGILIAFALELLARRDLAALGFGTAAHMTLLTRIMALTNRARVESRLHEAVSEAEEASAAGRLLDPTLLASYAKEIAGRPQSARGTTHISVIDGAGNLAALSLSNGEGCGIMLPGSGVMLNNMLGEEDLNPQGFQHWPEDSRISSMMAPSLAFLEDGTVAALGTGGSNRIRTSVLQVLSNLIDFAMTAAEAVAAPRLHLEGGLANLEAGFDAAARAAVASEAAEVMDWPHHSFFYGGVHTATRRPPGRPGGKRGGKGSAGGLLAAAGDPRRRGEGLVV
jgi:gamma-glutamyltranspeptidase/glutathione hydrolase